MVLKNTNENKSVFDDPFNGTRSATSLSSVAVGGLSSSKETRRNNSSSSPTKKLTAARTLSILDEILENFGKEPQENADQSKRPSIMELESKKLLTWQENLTWMRDYIDSQHKTDFFDLQELVSVFSQKEVLKKWFDLFDFEGEKILKQETWIENIKQKLRENDEKNWAELLEALAYVVCGEEEVTEEFFSSILTSKGVLEKLFCLINKERDGQVSKQEIMDFIANLTYARPRTGITKESLEHLERIFQEALGHKKELSFEDFKKIVNSRNSFFAERVFEIFDRDKSGSVSLSEFLDAMHQFAGKSPNDKFKFLFKVYDLDGDGLIQQSELQQVLKACMEENGMNFSPDQIEDLTMALFEDADSEDKGAITFEALKAQLEKHDGLLENLSISIDRWLVPSRQSQGKNKSFLVKIWKWRPYQLTLPYFRNNYVYVTFLLLYTAVNLGLFISRGMEYGLKGTNGYTIIARACGQCLNFNCMFILVLVLRQSITALRATSLASFLPLDHHLYLHKICGWLIFIFSIVHTLAHLLNFSLVIVPDNGLNGINSANHSLREWILTTTPGLFGLRGFEGCANPTGVALMVILIFMVVSSQPFLRKSGYFEVFYWSHTFSVPFFILTIFHGPRFYWWFLTPGIIFVIEKAIRLVRMMTERGKTYISSGVLLPSKVTHLVVQKPTNFNFCPGDFVFVNIPFIAKYEWHPLTISSAPEQDEVLWLHVRAVGQWTNRLYRYFERQQQKCEMQMANQDPKRKESKSLKINFELTNEHQNGIKKVHLERRKKGICNVAFESGPDVLQQKVEEKGEAFLNKAEELPSTKVFSSPICNPQKRVASRSKSLPHLMRKFSGSINGRRTNKKSNWRTKSEKPRKSSQMSNHESLLTSMAAADESVVYSCRYMRKKPTVITLDTPLELDSDFSDLDETSEMTDTDATFSGTATRNEKDLEKALDRVSRKPSRLDEAEARGQCVVRSPLVIYIDGPYGAPSSRIFRAQHAVLIATGIGVTPFASILQSIMHKYWKVRHTCPNCQYKFATSIPQSVMNLRKVDFFWINRDQKCFEWFVNLLSQLEIEQAEQGGRILDRFLDMHMYITSALQKTDMKAVGLQLALDLLHEKEKRDLITGLKTRTNAGRPNWDKVFSQLADQQKGKITVFYCGPPALGRTLRYKCGEYGFDFKKENF